MLSSENSSAEFHRNRACVRVAVALLIVGAGLNLLFLFNHCPFQLSQDEAHYWQWAQPEHLDYGYYSKPPGIAWLMAGTLKVATMFGVRADAAGQTLMPILRVPAVLFGVLSGLLSLFLARRFFRDDRASLAVILLSAAVPMFAIGSLLITIDSPMYLCWAATVYCLWRQVEGAGDRGKGSAWLYLAAIVCAVGMLFKPVLIAIPLCVLVGCWMDPQIRRAFRTWHTLVTGLIVLASQIPVLIWNSHHDWVTLRHIFAQGGIGGEHSGKPTNYLAPLAHFGEYVGGQAGGMGGLVFILLVIAVVLAIRLRKNPPASLAGQYALAADHCPLTTRLNFLLAFTLPLWLFYLALSFVKGTEPNWPAASYFTGMILLAGIFVAGWNSAVETTRKWWRVWGKVTIAWGVLLVAMAMNFPRFAPLLPNFAQKRIAPALIKLGGMEERAELLQTARQKLRSETGQEPILLANNYGVSSALTFYLPDHPFVYCLMSSTGGRHNQFDLWPGPNQVNAEGKLALAGRPALILGIDPAEPYVEKLLKPAFERLEGPEYITPSIEGMPGRTVPVYRGYGFKGFANKSSNTW